MDFGGEIQIIFVAHPLGDAVGIGGLAPPRPHLLPRWCRATASGHRGDGVDWSAVLARRRRSLSLIWVIMSIKEMLEKSNKRMELLGF